MSKEAKKAKKMKRTKPAISATDFVVAWNQAGSLDEVAKKFNTSTKNMSSKAVTFRRKGINLKKFDAGRGNHFDVEALNKLAVQSMKPSKKGKNANTNA